MTTLAVMLGLWAIGATFGLSKREPGDLVKLKSGSRSEKIGTTGTRCT